MNLFQSFNTVSAGFKDEWDQINGYWPKSKKKSMIGLIIAALLFIILHHWNFPSMEIELYDRKS
ncbi:hypothetical protein GCM10022414_33220 [Zhongshania borealis]|uniref:Uncharacterized protein n=1 Tax=Zhongshania borealis TaxID=889488 RepID=A0ABP7X467_9GAMM